MSLRQSFSYNVAIGTASALGARPVPFGITHIRIAADTSCYVVIGQAPTATVAGGMLISALNKGECFSVGVGDQVAVIAAAAGGNCNVTELTK
jgi:hypothetical protein